MKHYRGFLTLLYSGTAAVSCLAFFLFWIVLSASGHAV